MSTFFIQIDWDILLNVFLQSRTPGITFVRFTLSTTQTHCPKMSQIYTGAQQKIQSRTFTLGACTFPWMKKKGWNPSNTKWSIIHRVSTRQDLWKSVHVSAVCSGVHLNVLLTFYKIIRRLLASLIQSGQICVAPSDEVITKSLPECCRHAAERRVNNVQHGPAQFEKTTQQWFCSQYIHIHCMIARFLTSDSHRTMQRMCVDTVYTRGDYSFLLSQQTTFLWSTEGMSLRFVDLTRTFPTAPSSVK